jgi:hypothetical protein
VTSPLVLEHCYMQGAARWWSCIAASVAVVVVVVMAFVGSIGGILPRFVV